MKKFAVKLLCLAAALMLPLSSALAEPLPWLRPFIDRMAGQNPYGRTEMTIHVDGQAAQALADALADRMEKSYAVFLDSDGFARVRARLDQQRRTWKTYASAIGALLEETKIIVSSGEGSAVYDVRIGEGHWFTLGLSMNEAGRPCLVSDLFPSFALELDSVQQDFGRFSISLDVDPGEEGKEKALLAGIQDVLSALPEYEDFHLLNETLSAYRRGLDALAETGAARREGDAVIYEIVEDWMREKTGKDDLLDAMLSGGTVEMDPRLARIIRLTSRETEEEEPKATAAPAPTEAPKAAVPEAEDPGAEKDPLQKQADALKALIGRLGEGERQRASYIRRYTLRGDEITFEAFVGKPETPFAETAALLRGILDQSEDGMVSFWRVTPTAVEYFQDQGLWMDRHFTLDAGSRDEIRLCYWEGDEKEKAQSVDAVISRTEEGQRVEIAVSIPDSGLLDENDQPLVIGLTMAYDNAFSRFQGTLSTSLTGSLAEVVSTNAYGAEPFGETDVSRLTVIPLNPPAGAAGKTAAVWDELRSVGVPRLNRLVLTSLPAGAQPLMTPLLGLVGQLAQLGK